jgi:probable HAF family extracellular repeat protein
MKIATRHSLSLATIVLLMAGTAGAADRDDASWHPQLRYRIAYLESLGGSSIGSSINNLGWVAGRSTTADGVRRASLWRNGRVTDLGTLGVDPDLRSSVVWPVKNVRGMITGIAETDRIDPEDENWSCSAFLGGRPSGERRQCLGFVWENGSMQPLPTLGGTHGFATGSNNRGQVVGWAETTVRDPENCVPPQKFQFRAVQWEPRRNRIQELSPVVSEGDSVSAATAINDRGQVVGISGICDNAVGRFSAIRAVMWENGVPTVLGDIGGSAWNTPMAINWQGDVVGFANQSETIDGALDWGAFLWTRQHGMEKLPTLEGDLNAQANGINLWRVAVGRSCAEADMADCDAVVWKHGRVHQLSALVRDFPATGRLITAVDIDDLGRITGQAIHPATGAFVAYVATPTLF